MLTRVRLGDGDEVFVTDPLFCKSSVQVFEDVFASTRGDSTIQVSFVSVAIGFNMSGRVIDPLMIGDIDRQADFLALMGDAYDLTEALPVKTKIRAESGGLLALEDVAEDVGVDDEGEPLVDVILRDAFGHEDVEQDAGGVAARAEDADVDRILDAKARRLAKGTSLEAYNSAATRLKAHAPDNFDDVVGPSLPEDDLMDMHIHADVASFDLVIGDTSASASSSSGMAPRVLPSDDVQARGHEVFMKALEVRVPDSMVLGPATPREQWVPMRREPYVASNYD
jgi:hypothetical protein